MPTAVHFGAGNIGRGFVGFLLHRAGYELIFTDVNSELITKINSAKSYTVHEVGLESSEHEVTGFRGINSAHNQQELIDEIAVADVVTTAVGPSILKFIAPVIAEGIKKRSSNLPKLAVMACENAIGATDTLRDHVATSLGGDWQNHSAKAAFANTAVDRIVPGQAVDNPLDVVVENYYEWAIESAPFDDDVPDIPGVTWVDDLTPYIERKLFTVNTGHAATAYFGYLAGHNGIAECLADEKTWKLVYQVLQETKELIVYKHDFAPEVQEAYIGKILQRFANPYLSDTVARVGRQPLRKVSRYERFIGPAAALAERGSSVSALMSAVSALLRFDIHEDEESVELQHLLHSAASDIDITVQITGLSASHVLVPLVASEVAKVRSGL